MQLLVGRFDGLVVLLHIRQLLGDLLHLTLLLVPLLAEVEELLPYVLCQAIRLVQLHIWLCSHLGLRLCGSEGVHAATLVRVVLLLAPLALRLGLLAEQLEKHFDELLGVREVHAELLLNVALLHEVLLVQVRLVVQLPLPIHDVLRRLRRLALDLLQHARQLGYLDLHLLTLHHVLRQLDDPQVQLEDLLITLEFIFEQAEYRGVEALGNLLVLLLDLFKLLL
mmetsp:Transcript_148955/g.260284  ORF Transcript_148955/g.260284 Transcript_148955/m.260284 type:complete len:224 (+) Transcript_148955:1253-1924(+)